MQNPMQNETTQLLANPPTETGAITVNVAFLKEIKEDNVHFGELLEAIKMSLETGSRVQDRVLAELLGRLRDELETHFALEEFYGYFKDATVQNNQVGKVAQRLCGEHVILFVQLNDLVEDAERLLYKEPPRRTKEEVMSGFGDFYNSLKKHEQDEMLLMMRLWNEDIGDGD